MDMNMFIARLNWLWKFWRENGPSGEIMSWFTDLKQGYLEVSFSHGGDTPKVNIQFANWKMAQSK